MSELKKLLVTRISNDNNQCLGTFAVSGTELFMGKTLELPWKNNQHDISCIPRGIYICKYTRSNRLSALAGHDVFTYEVLDVPGRAGIRIHSANYFFQLLGCIALGDAHKDINVDGNLDVVHSGATVAKLVEIMEKKDFILQIENHFA